MKAPRWIVLLAALAAVSPARAAEFAASMGGLGFSFQLSRAMPQMPAPAAAPAARIPLAPLLDNVRGTRAAFRARNGAVVHVFGDKSVNKKNWFIGFAEESAPDAQFRQGKKMLHWMVLKRTVHFDLGGTRYDAWIEGKATDKMHSVVVVEPSDHRGPRATWTVQELTDDAYDAGYPVTLAGREYRLLYTRDFDEDVNGEFSGYTGDRSITLLTKEGGSVAGLHWFEREIPRDRVLVTTPKLNGADDARAGTTVLGLKLDGSTLELYGVK